jgi:Xaa-Pro aminopeptidase
MTDLNLDKLIKLRALMAAQNIDAFMIPTADAHISEYVSEHDKRRSFISEFHGSAGTALVTQTEALLWTDGRYFLQATKELPPHWTLMKQGLPDVPTLQDWCAANLKPQQTLGFDPYLIPLGQFKTFVEVLNDAQVKFVPLSSPNLVDQIWTEQPPMSNGEIRVHALEYAGETPESKIKKVQEKMLSNKSFALVLCALDEVAWLLNLRGCDISFNPVFLSYVVITLDKVHFFVEQAKFGPDVQFDPNLVQIHPYGDVTKFMASLKPLSAEAKANNKPYKVWVDNSKSNYAVFAALDAEEIVITTANPVTLMKAIKNKAEIEGMKQAHVRDGAALSRFLAWFESQFSTLPSITDSTDAIKASPWNEFTIAEKLEAFRKETDKFVGLSFDSISSVGPNGAIIHYKPDEITASPVTGGNIYLLDSGAQLLDGTTDVTRTFWIPSNDIPHPRPFEKDAFTRVLQGHIGLASITFPQQTMGPSLDVLARAALWAVGLDYMHGTGHGVGAHINVHEGPLGVAKMNRGGAMCTTALVEGMVLSNEPGYYHDGEFGIRIENLIHIVPKETKYVKAGWLGFEDLTMVPIDRTLINKEDLTQQEIQWVDEYHQKVRTNLSPYIANDPATLAWVTRNTEPL